MKLVRAIGLMSGTSMDGVDLAFIETDGQSVVRLGPAAFQPYSEEDRALLRAALAEAPGLNDRASRPGSLGLAEAMVTDRHAEAVEAFLARDHIAVESVDVLGFHGQTVLHRPEARMTVQIGDGPALATRLGLKVVHDFRAADIAAGGQGAPLVPVFHRALVEAAVGRRSVAVVNIGGVANLTFVPGGGVDPIACDTGPGNAMLDDLVRARTGQPFDRDGAIASAGKVDEIALEQLLAHPFFALPAPKSLDRNAFSLAPVAGLRLEDAAATLVAFTARAIADALAPFGPLRQVIICGGGARNPAILRELSARIACPVEIADRLGWSADFMEAQAFAYLAVRSLQGQPLTFPTTTGVARPLTGGEVALPRR